MIVGIFAVYDVKAEAYMQPFFFTANGQAIRAFKDLCNDKNTTPGRHPADFRLDRIGEFDDRTGMIVGVPISFLGYGTEYVDSPSVGLKENQHTPYHIPETK